MQVTIGGQTYTLRADENAEHIQQVARYVDTRFRELMSQTAGTVSRDRLGVLVALNVADELLKTRSSLREREQAARERATDILRVIDENLEQ